MKHDLAKGEECKGVFVKDGILDVRHLAKILRILGADGRVLITGVKTVSLPAELMEACAKAAEAS